MSEPAAASAPSTSGGRGGSQEGRGRAHDDSPPRTRAETQAAQDAERAVHGALIADVQRQLGALRGQQTDARDANAASLTASVHETAAEIAASTAERVRRIEEETAAMVRRQEQQREQQRLDFEQQRLDFEQQLERRRREFAEHRREFDEHRREFAEQRDALRSLREEVTLHRERTSQQSTQLETRLAPLQEEQAAVRDIVNATVAINDARLAAAEQEEAVHGATLERLERESARRDRGQDQGDVRAVLDADLANLAVVTARVAAAQEHGTTHERNTRESFAALGDRITEINEAIVAQRERATEVDDRITAQRDRADATLDELRIEIRDAIQALRDNGSTLGSSATATGDTRPDHHQSTAPGPFDPGGDERLLASLTKGGHQEGDAPHQIVDNTGSTSSDDAPSTASPHASVAAHIPAVLRGHDEDRATEENAYVASPSDRLELDVDDMRDNFNEKGDHIDDLHVAIPAPHDSTDAGPPTPDEAPRHATTVSTDSIPTAYVPGCDKRMQASMKLRRRQDDDNPYTIAESLVPSPGSRLSDDVATKLSAHKDPRLFHTDESSHSLFGCNGPGFHMFAPPSVNHDLANLRAAQLDIPLSTHKVMIKCQQERCFQTSHLTEGVIPHSPLRSRLAAARPLDAYLKFGRPLVFDDRRPLRHAHAHSFAFHFLGCSPRCPSTRSRAAFNDVTSNPFPLAPTCVRPTRKGGTIFVDLRGTLQGHARLTPAYYLDYDETIGAGDVISGNVHDQYGHGQTKTGDASIRVHQGEVRLHSDFQKIADLNSAMDPVLGTEIAAFQADERFRRIAHFLQSRLHNKMYYEIITSNRSTTRASLQLDPNYVRDPWHYRDYDDHLETSYVLYTHTARQIYWTTRISISTPTSVTTQSTTSVTQVRSQRTSLTSRVPRATSTSTWSLTLRLLRLLPTSLSRPSLPSRSRHHRLRRVQISSRSSYHRLRQVPR